MLDRDLFETLDHIERAMTILRESASVESLTESWRNLARRVRASGLPVDQQIRTIMMQLRRQRGFLRARANLAKMFLTRISLTVVVLIATRIFLFGDAELPQELWQIDRGLVLGGLVLAAGLIWSFIGGLHKPWWCGHSDGGEVLEHWCASLLCDKPAASLPSELLDRLRKLHHAELVDGLCRAEDRANTLDDWAQIRSEDDQTHLNRNQLAMPWLEIAAGMVIAVGLCGAPLLTRLEASSQFMS